MRAPRYGQASLVEVIPSVLAALGDRTHDNHLALPEAAHAVLVVVDGLGHLQLQEAAADAPLLAAAADAAGPIDAAFPTTTPCGLASLTLGLPPGRHGLVGATFLLPDFDRVLNPLHWQHTPPPVAVQPEPTLFRGTDIPVRSHGPAQYVDSGLTRVLLDGATPEPYERFAAARVEARPGTLDYVYLPDLDKAGHLHGPGAPAWRNALRQVEAHIAALVAGLPPDSIIVVTADHGMVWVPDDRRIDVDAPELQAGVSRMAGEPRMRHLYTASPTAVQARWHARLGERAHVLLRSEAVDAGLVGDADEMLIERIGDVIAIARDDWAFTSRLVDPKPSGLRGLHGALTDAELLVPRAVLRGAA